MKNNDTRSMRLAVIGAGSRGRAYSKYSEIPDSRLEIVSVADPDREKLQKFSEMYNISKELQFSSGVELLKANPEVDTILIATPDRTHVQLATAFSEAGYHIILEKPIGIDLKEVNTITNMVNTHEEQLFGICHVLLYTPLTRTIKEILKAGSVGEIVSIQHLEPIGYWHYMHSYVRGNWRREDTSSPLLLAKSCHDIDWIMHIMQEDVEYVSSFGSLNYFHKRSKPDNSSDRCIDCSLDGTCPYSANRFYRNQLKNGNFNWPLDVVISEFTEEALDYALRFGPYGMCVYNCDNSVVDNQVVNIQFKNCKTASFSVTAFSEVDFRQTRIFCTKGMIETNGIDVKVFSFLNNNWETITVVSEGVTAADGHGGGDFGFMEAYITAWQRNDYSEFNKRTLEGCSSHRIVFAAEEARLKNCVTCIDDFL